MMLIHIFFYAGYIRKERKERKEKEEICKVGDALRTDRPPKSETNIPEIEKSEIDAEHQGSSFFLSV